MPAKGLLKRAAHKGRWVSFVLAGALLASGCSASKVVLGQPASPCFRTVPIAKDVVHGIGHLVGVRATDTVSLLRAIRASGVLSMPPTRLVDQHGKTERVCLVAYRGRFNSDDVAKPWLIGERPSGFAVVVVRESDNRALTTILVGHHPIRLTRAFPLPG